jgi:Zn-dependent peptidase ImmA (M78 family)
MYVNELASSLNITQDDFPINAEYIARKHCNNVTIEQLPFPSTDICGILYKGKNSTSIALNASRSDTMRNFDCMHELIHYFFHDIEDRQYICSVGNSGECSIVQDSYTEWQANEGAAQFLVPYESLLPLIKEKGYYLGSYDGIYSLREGLANKFNVTEDVIRIRFESLKYEIHQHLNGCNLDKIRILSAKKQTEKGIDIRSLNDMAMKYVDLEFTYGYVSEDEKELLDDLKFGYSF